MIELEHRGRVTVLHMVRGRGNALDISFLNALIDALSLVERSECGAAVLTGQGRVFARASIYRRWSRAGRITCASSSH